MKALEEFTISPQTITEGWTQSELSTLDQCGYKWYLQYNQRLYLPGGYSFALMFGTAWHSAMEQMYRTKFKRWSVPVLAFPEDATPKQEEEAELEYWQTVLEAMLTGYTTHYQDDAKFFDLSEGKVEYVADVDIVFDNQKIRLKGKLDMMGIYQLKVFMMDHKTTSLLNATVLRGWDFKFQFMFYVWLAYKLKLIKNLRRFFVNAVKKPQIRQKQAESLDQFSNRLIADMRERPETYFFRQQLIMSANSIEHFEKTVLEPKLIKIALLQNPSTPLQTKQMIAFNRNTDACHSWGRTCQFFNICEHGLKNEIENFKQRETKHQEYAEAE